MLTILEFPNLHVFRLWEETREKPNSTQEEPLYRGETVLTTSAAHE